MQERPIYESNDTLRRSLICMKQFPCPICPAELLQSFRDVEEHMTYFPNHGATFFSCYSCGLSFLTFKMLSYHNCVGISRLPLEQKKKTKDVFNLFTCKTCVQHIDAKVKLNEVNELTVKERSELENKFVALQAFYTKHFHSPINVAWYTFRTFHAIKCEPRVQCAILHARATQATSTISANLASDLATLELSSTDVSNFYDLLQLHSVKVRHFQHLPNEGALFNSFRECSGDVAFSVIFFFANFAPVEVKDARVECAVPACNFVVPMDKLVDHYRSIHEMDLTLGPLHDYFIVFNKTPDERKKPRASKRSHASLGDSESDDVDSNNNRSRVTFACNVEVCDVDENSCIEPVSEISYDGYSMDVDGLEVVERDVSVPWGDCRLCGLLIVGKGRLEMHYKAHPESKMFGGCRWCKEAFESVEEFVDHVFYVHTEDKGNQDCRFCRFCRKPVLGAEAVHHVVYECCSVPSCTLCDAPYSRLDPDGMEQEENDEHAHVEFKRFRCPCGGRFGLFTEVEEHHCKYNRPKGFGRCLLCAQLVKVVDYDGHACFYDVLPFCSKCPEVLLTTDHVRGEHMTSTRHYLVEDSANYDFGSLDLFNDAVIGYDAEMIRRELADCSVAMVNARSFVERVKACVQMS